jgi:hypothetical protein
VYLDHVVALLATCEVPTNRAVTDAVQEAQRRTLRVVRT